MSESAGKDMADDLAPFAAIINSRLGVQARILRAKGFGWLCGGLAVAFFLSGIGALLAFYGYSHMVSIRPATEQIAQVLVHALEHAQLTTSVTGTMSLPPNAEIKLADGQMVKLEQKTPLKLDPNSSVRIVGNLKLDVPQPSKGQLQVDLPSKTGERPLTDYTIFRSGQYGSGVVVTGWNFEPSEPSRPRLQHCYYQETVTNGKHVKIMLSINDAPLKSSSTAKPSINFNFDEALSNCVWFTGM
jgi:hypothetical protein